MAEATRLKIAIDVSGIPELSKLRAAIKNVENSSKILGKEFGRSRQQLKLLEQSVKPSINSTRALRDSFRELANQVAFGSKQFKQATREADRLDKQLARMERRKGGGRIGGLKGAAQIGGLAAASGIFGGPEASVGTLIGGISGGFAGAQAGAAVGATISQMRQAVGSAAEYAAEIDGLQIALKNVYPEQQQFNKALAFTERMTTRFNTPLEDNTKNFARLSAAVVGAGGDLDTAKIAFRAITVAMKANRKSAADIDSAMLALTQVFSKGKVAAEELVGQIGERLPGAVTDFAKATNRDLPQLQKDFESGTVSLNDMVEFLIFTFDKYEEGALKMAGSTADAGARMNTELDFLKKEFGDLFKGTGAGFQDMIAGAANMARRMLVAFKNVSDKIQPFVNIMTTAFKKIARAALVFLGPVGTLVNAILRAAKIKLPDAPATDPSEDLDPAIFDTPDPKDLSGGRGRKDISERLLRASEAAIRETNEKRKVALELEAELLRIQESGRLANEKELEIIKASVNAKNKMAEIDKKADDRRKKALDDYKKMLGSFVLGGQTQFDMNAQGEAPKTPFDMLRQGADDFTDSLKGALEASKQLAQVGLQGISDGITNLVVNGTLNFREFAASLLRDMARIIMQQIVMKSLMQAIGFGGGGVDLSGFQLGNQRQFDVSMLGAPKFAKGGITRGVSIAGEAGPEAVVPLPDGRSIPVTMQGEGTKVVVNVDAKGTSAQGDSGRANQLGEAIGAAVRQELLKQKRPGGLLA